MGRTYQNNFVKSSFSYYDGFENDVKFFADQCEDDDIVEYVAGCIEDDGHPTESPEEFDSLMRAVQVELKNQGYFKQPWQVNQSRKPLQSSAYTREQYEREDEYGNYIPYQPTPEELALKDEIKKALGPALADAYEDDPMDHYAGIDTTEYRIEAAYEDVAKQFGVDQDFVEDIAAELQNEENERQMKEWEWVNTPGNLTKEQYDQYMEGELDVRPLMTSSRKTIKSEYDPIEYEEGYDAYFNGYDITANPYKNDPVGSFGLQQWEQGWKDAEANDENIMGIMKPLKSSKEPATKEQIEKELDRVLEKRKVSLDNESYNETVDYILSFWDDEFPPQSVKEAVAEWYNDTKRNFPDMFEGKRIASALYLRYIRSARKPIKSGLDIYEGARFKNPNNVTVEILEVDDTVKTPDGSPYVLYTIDNGLPRDTTVDGITAMLSQNSYIKSGMSVARGSEPKVYVLPLSAKLCKEFFNDGTWDWNTMCSYTANGPRGIVYQVFGANGDYSHYIYDTSYGEVMKLVSSNTGRELAEMINPHKIDMIIPGARYYVMK